MITLLLQATLTLALSPSAPTASKAPACEGCLVAMSDSLEARDVRLYPLPLKAGCTYDVVLEPRVGDPDLAVQLGGDELCSALVEGTGPVSCRIEAPAHADIYAKVRAWTTPTTFDLYVYEAFCRS